jgi:hypothetical protein
MNGPRLQVTAHFRDTQRGQPNQVVVGLFNDAGSQLVRNALKKYTYLLSSVMCL